MIVVGCPDQARGIAKVSRYAVLCRKVVLKFVVVFNDLVTTALQSMNEGTAPVVVKSLAVVVVKEVDTVFARAKGALQRTIFTYF